MKRLIFIFMIFLCFRLNAQWQQLKGPHSSGKIIRMDADDSSVITSNLSGTLMISSDGGDSWFREASFSSGVGYDAVAVSNSLMFASNSTGVHRSTDFGVHWNMSLTQYSIINILIDKNDVYAGGYGQFFYSGNSGTNWIERSADSLGMITALSIKEGVLYAGSKYAGIHRSVNKGFSWVPVSNGLPENSFVSDILQKDSIVYAALYGNGIYYSVNKGDSWFRLNAGNTDQWIQKLTVKDSLIYASTSQGMLKYINKGSLWQQAGSGLNSLAVFSIAAQGLNLFAATDSGLFVSSDKGKEWSLVPQYMTEYSVSDILRIDSSLFIATSNGGYKSQNEGENWIPLTINPVTCFLVRNDSLFAGAGEGVMISRDDGTTWLEKRKGLPGYANKLASNAKTIFGGFYYNGLYRTDDGGENWLKVNSIPNGNAVTEIKMTGDTIVVANNKGQLFISTDNGTNWSVCTTGFPTGSEIGGIYLQRDNLFITLIYEAKVYQFDWNNQRWNSISNGLTKMNIGPITGWNNKLMLGTANGVLLTTRDSVNWIPLATGMKTSLITSLTTSGEFLYAGTKNNGTWKIALSRMTGVPEKVQPESRQFTVYPNPSTGKFKLTGLMQPGMIQIFNLLGEIVISSQLLLNDGSIEIDLGDLARGAYLVKTQNDSQACFARIFCY